ncbi:MAG: dihydrodipicolinate synthase family protein [Verrucomicrobiota bacterium]
MPKLREGIIAALWTPTDEKGRLRVRDMENNLRFICGKNVDGIMALGSTGEFLHLDVTQRKQLLELAVANAGTVPVIANISDIRPAIVADLGRFAGGIGVTAVALLTPYFYPVAQADLVEFFVRAGEAVNLPLFLYNFPERTGNRIELETVAAVADRLPLVGIKQSGAGFEYHRELVALGREKNFVVLTGADTRIPEAMAMGVTGCVSGLANAVPDLVVEIFNATKAGKKSDVAAERMRTVGTLVERLEFPLNVAAAMEARGLPVGYPKSMVSPSTKTRHHQLVLDLRQLFEEWKLI